MAGADWQPKELNPFTDMSAWREHGTDAGEGKVYHDAGTCSHILESEDSALVLMGGEAAQVKLLGSPRSIMKSSLPPAQQQHQQHRVSQQHKRRKALPQWLQHLTFPCVAPPKVVEDGNASQQCEPATSHLNQLLQKTASLLPPSPKQAVGSFIGTFSPSKRQNAPQKQQAQQCQEQEAGTDLQHSSQQQWRALRGLKGRTARDKCRAWLAQQQERIQERLAHRGAALRLGRGGRKSSLQEAPSCVRPRLLRDLCSTSTSSEDGCVKVYIGAGAAAAAAEKLPARRTASSVELATLGDAWHAIGESPCHPGGTHHFLSRMSTRAPSIAGSEAQWFDALSRFDSQEGPSLHNDVDAMLRDLCQGQQQLMLPRAPSLGRGSVGGQGRLQPPGPHVPEPPLLFAGKDFTFVPVPVETGFGGYWLKDPARTSPNPQPIDVMLGASRIAIKAHETIPGVWLQDGPCALTMTAKPRSIPLGPLSRYVETFSKDGSTTAWTMRRDVKIGRSTGQMYFTECGTLIFRVYAKGMWSNEPEYVCEEYSHLEDNGTTIVSRQCCKHFATGKVAEQHLVGTWAGAIPPPGHT